MKPKFLPGDRPIRNAVLRRTGRGFGFLALALALALAACSRSEEKKPGGRPDRAAPVTATKAAQKNAPVIIRAVGVAEAFATVSVKTPVGGMIVEQYVRDGQDVVAGQPLFMLDPRPFELAIKEAQGKLEQDRAKLVKAEADLKRNDQLKGRDVIAQGQYDEAFAAAKTLEGSIKLDEAALDRARLDLEYASVKAPIAGRAGSVLLHKGNVIKANDDRSLLVINQIEPIYVSFSVPEAHLSQIMAMAAKGRVEIEAFAPGFEDSPEKGELAAVNNAVDAQTGTIRLKGLFKNADHRLWPGQFLRTSLRMADLKDAVMIPTAAVMTGIKGAYVYVVKDDMTAEARPVVAGPIIDEETVIEKGLAPGETVVVEGQLRLAPGSKVEIKDKGQAGAPEPKAGGGPAKDGGKAEDAKAADKGAGAPAKTAEGAKAAGEGAQ